MSALGNGDPVAEGHLRAAPALEVTGLHVTLAGRPIDVIEDVNFTLAPGEVLGLVGESGSGKTTVALALLGYARPGTSIAGGSVVVNGADLLTYSRKELRRLRGKLVSYIPQDPSSSLNPSIRIGTQVLEVLEDHGIGSDGAARRERLVEVLQEVDLPSRKEFLARYPHELSGGQQQRVAIAMAFVCRPRVVVLDEPTTGLDVTTQAHVLKTVKILAESHRTAAVYVSHDLAVVAGLCLRIAVMYAGRLIELGPTYEITHAAAHPYTRLLVAAAPDPKQRRPAAGIPGRVAALGPRVQGCGFADRCEFVEAACRTGVISEEGIDVEHAVRCRRWEFVRSRPRPDSNGAGLHAADVRPSGSSLLQIENLVACYGGNKVLHGVTFSIPRGRCLALVGESGSGKTTLARCISGMHREASGTIRLGDEILPWGSRRRSPEVRRTIQYIFQTPYGSLNPRKTVRELLQHPLKHFRCAPDHDLVPELLEMVTLSPHYAGRYPSQLSGGERQRVAIARALAVSPEVLICDEITSALDVSVQASILSLLARLHAETSLTVLFVTHNLAVVRAIADAVVVLNDGSVVEEGLVDEVLDHPKNAYTQTLLRDTPGLY